ISRIALSIVSAPLNKIAQFVINRFDFNTPSSVIASVSATEPTTPDAANHSRLSPAFSRLSLSLEANQGQTDSRVDFPSRGAPHLSYRPHTTAGVFQSTYGVRANRRQSAFVRGSRGRFLFTDSARWGSSKAF